ncbi:type II secretion system protein GspG [Pontiella sp.]|uniref:type II secretion system protein GspG n=1 Tax=Pontiella sp. TaxID=2837462 RepID=UPI0035651A31
MKEKQNNKHLAKRSGFTLIEVILVVVILGIIAGVTMKGLNIGGKKEMADVMDAKSTIAGISMAIDAYEVMNGTYPSSLDGLLDSSKAGFPFLKKNSVPLDPWGKPFTYSSPGSHNTHGYDISCTTPKGESINNWE